MTVMARLHAALATLGLTEADAVLEAHLERAAKEERAYAEVLCELRDREVEARRARYLRTRMRLAHLPFTKTLDHQYRSDAGARPGVLLQALGRSLLHSGRLAVVYERGVGVYLPGPESTYKLLLFAELDWRLLRAFDRARACVLQSCSDDGAPDRGLVRHAGREWP